MTVYSLDVLLFQFGTSPLFHVQFYWFLNCLQVSQEAGKMVCYSHLFKNFPQFVVIHTGKGFSLVNEAEVDVFLEFFCFFVWSNRCWQFDLWFLCLFYVSLNIWKFLVHVLLKPSLKNFEYYLVSMWNEGNCVVVWTFFGIILWDWNENSLFPVLWPLLSFPDLLTHWVQHFNSIIFYAVKLT